MKPQPKFIILFFIICGLFNFLPSVQACSCVLERPVCEKFGSSTAVFLGKAIKATQIESDKDEKGRRIIYLTGQVFFEIEEAFSGVKGQKRVRVESGGGCGTSFLQGESYLIYASGNNVNQLRTSMCAGNHLTEEARDDLAFLRRLPPEGSGGKLFGEVARRAQVQDKDDKIKMEGLAGITIKIKDSSGQTQTIETDQQGKYEILGIKSGTYKVEAELPEGYKTGEYKSEQEFSVQDRGCANVSFWAQPDNRIIGRVTETDGAIPEKVKLVLIKVGAKETGNPFRDEAATAYFESKNKWNKNGHFDFGRTETLEPGEYLLGVNVSDNPDEDSPYPPTYYPGVKDPTQAAILKVDLGTVIEDIVFQLPPKLHKHTIRGIVFWPDGRPVAKAEIYLQDESRPGWSINGFEETDAQGRFTLSGYKGFNYEIVAEAEKFPNAAEGKKQEMEAEPYKITLTNDVAGIKIILTKEKKKDE